MCKTLNNRAKTICEVSNIEWLSTAIHRQSYTSQNKLFRFLCTHKDSIVRESIEKEKHNTIDQEGKPLDSMWHALFNVQN